MVFPRVRSRRSVPTVRLALVAALTLLVLAPTGALAVPRSSAAGVATSTAAPSADPFGASVTWNGVNVSTAGSASSALSINFADSAIVLFKWTARAGAANPNDARLQMIYFGFALSTRDVVNSGTQNFANMTWTPGALVYVLEGTFEITASLLQPNGTTLWSENFWVRASAPYSIFALLPIILIVIIAWELYSVARSGRQALLSQKRAKAPPTAPEEPAPAEPTPPPTAEEAAPESAPESGPEDPK
jgi:hypothetical protein